MASQTEAPDDLIAELARLMADDARSDQTARTPEPAPQTPPKPAPVRIPGGESLEAKAPAFPPVRIPGEQTRAEPNPYDFDFDLNLKRGETSPVVPAPQIAEEPVFAATPRDADPLDHDALADLIAAELANDLVPPEPLPVVEGPARDDDNFGVPPVFGLGSSQAPEPVMVRVEPDFTAAPEPEPVPEPVFEEIVHQPQPVQPQAPLEPEPALDPLADIERLVAPAVLKPQQDTASARAPSPALRSLATPTLPIAEPEPAPVAPAPRAEPGSVDDAILAAAAATGARVEWVNAAHDETQSDAEDNFEAAGEPRRRFTMSRAVAGPLVAIALLGVAGGGLYWVLGQGGGPSGPAPLLVADTAPVKEVAEPAEPSSQQSVVFNEISGSSNPDDEQIVPRDQADQATVDEAVATNSGSGVLATNDGTGIDPNQDGLVNRKVRTVTVRPDGTIISGAESMAGSSILPVERPNVPEVPGADFSTPDLIAATDPAAATPAAPVETAVPAAALVTAGSVVPVIDLTGAPVAGRSVTIPSTRPADFAQAAAAALAASAVPATNNAVAPVAAPAQTTAPAVTTTSGGASAYVQLASQRSEDAARQSAQSMSTRFGVLFGGAAPEIQRVDLGERGIYYRVLVPAASRDAAANICTNIKAAGGDCLLL